LFQIDSAATFARARFKGDLKHFFVDDWLKEG